MEITLSVFFAKRWHWHCRFRGGAASLDHLRAGLSCWNALIGPDQLALIFGQCQFNWLLRQSLDAEAGPGGAAFWFVPSACRDRHPHDRPASSLAAAAEDRQGRDNLAGRHARATPTSGFPAPVVSAC